MLHESERREKDDVDVATGGVVVGVAAISGPLQVGCQHQPVVQALHGSRRAGLEPAQVIRRELDQYRVADLKVLVARVGRVPVNLDDVDVDADCLNAGRLLEVGVRQAELRLRDAVAREATEGQEKQDT